MAMTKTELRKFIKENREQIERFASAQNSGRLSREQQKEYEGAYNTIVPNAHLCFTCGRSAQLMGRALLKWEEDNKPKRRKQ